MKFSDKHIVITGGASGIGLELVRQLQPDNSVTVIARSSRHLEQLRKDFQELNVIEADLANLETVANAADQLVKSDRNIDILINNAAVQYTPHFLDDDFRFETIRREIDINFTSVCTLIYLLLPKLEKDDPSIIMNVNSGLALAPKTSSAIYCATKGALNIFSQSLGHQLENTNIAVKQVFLPLVDTAMTQGRGKGKLSPDHAASEIIKALSSSSTTTDIGKVKLLRFIQRLSLRLATNIMKRG